MSRRLRRRPWTGDCSTQESVRTPVIAPVDDQRESSPWQEVHELSEQGLAGVHEHSSEKLRKVLHPIQIDTMHFRGVPAEILALKASTAGQQ